MDRYAIYLRKSRADVEAEARGEGETLAKHKHMLYKFAKEHQLNIIRKPYEEIVSGESVIHRPQMIQLLKDVADGFYDGVLCMDMERLGRGDMQDQGLILNTFKSSNTKIITLRKTYDLNDEIDEEMSEMDAFMARRELKMITRRLQRGRLETVEEGNYIGTNPPFGYKIKDLQRGRTLEPHPEQALVVKLIFEWYTDENPHTRLGSARIANKLNKLGYKTYTGGVWNSWNVLNIIKNAVYAGRIQWKRKEIKKSVTPGKKKDTRTRPRSEWIDVKGKHEPLISMETYEKAQYILKHRTHPPFHLGGIKNPLAGILKCGKCGATMILRPYTTQKPHMMCVKQKQCHTKSTQFYLIEKRLLDSLEAWLTDYKAQWQENELPKDDDAGIDVWKNTLNNLHKEAEILQKQKNSLFDYLERKIYTEEVFLERSQTIADRLSENQLAIQETEKELENEKKRISAQQEIIPSVEKVLDLYKKTDDPADKNALLKSVLDKVEYFKSRGQFKDDFDLVLYPRLRHEKLTQI